MRVYEREVEKEKTPDILSHLITASERCSDFEMQQLNLVAGQQKQFMKDTIHEELEKSDTSSEPDNVKSRKKKRGRPRKRRYEEFLDSSSNDGKEDIDNSDEMS